MTPDALVYSNYVNIVWFIFGHPVQSLPFEDQTLSRADRLEALERGYARLAGAAGLSSSGSRRTSTITLLPRMNSTEIADLQLLFEDDDRSDIRCAHASRLESAKSSAYRIPGLLAVKTPARQPAEHGGRKPRGPCKVGHISYSHAAPYLISTTLNTSWTGTRRDK